MKTRDEILEALNDDQREVVTKIGGKYAVVAGPGSGKAARNDTPVQTPAGPIKIGDITPGTPVFGTDGEVYTVTDVHPQGLKKVWEVEFSEGTITHVCKDHLWTFRQRNNDVFQTLTTKDIHKTIDLYRDGEANVFMPKIVAPESLSSDTRERLNSRELYITDIRPTEREVEMTCITVDSPDHLFLIEDFIPTHNTHSMISRAAYLISSGVKPWEILMITFTKKAAGEISERLISYIGEEAVDVNTGTFHSVALRILLANQAVLGFDKSLTVIEEEESLKIITDLCVSHGYSSDDGAREIKDYISNWQTENLSPVEVEELEEYPEDIVIIYKEYQHLKRSIGYIDFNDILNLSVYLLEKFPNILKKYSEQYKYIIVDETQDSNSTNLRMVELLASTHNNFMLVMDDEQSIYGFRGANLDAVLETLNNHEGLEVLNLEQNFRSTQTIVNASSAVIKRNTNQLAKNVFSKNKKGSPILAYDATDEAREGEFISEVISSLVSSGQYEYDDFMILYRTHWKSKAIEACLNQKGIPYSIVGGTEFYEREDVKNLVAYLRLIDNRFDDLALERVINVPKRGIGAKTVDRINVFASQAQIPMFSALENIDDVPKINKPTKKKIGEFHDLIEAQHELSRDPDASIADMLYTILQETEYFHDFDNLRLAHQERIEIIERLCKIAEDFDKRDKHELEEGQSIISQFLTETSLYVEDNENGEAAPRVQMLTSHASKGLEAPVVFIAGLEQGVFPSSRALTGEEREEERRLFYVSMTRAEEVLFLTHSEKSYGYGKTKKNRPSMFLSEIPEEYIHWLGQKHEEVPF